MGIEGMAHWPPVSVRGIEYRRRIARCQRNGNELPVAAIERRQLLICRELCKPTLWVRRDVHHKAMPRVGLPLPQPLEERITHARLPGERAMFSIFGEDVLGIVDHDARRSGLRQCVDAGAHALRAGRFVLAVGHDQHIRIDNDAHFAWPPRRRKIAFCIAAISSNSSPKNPSGQFSILP